MTQLRIGIDIDDVLIGSVDRTITLYNEIYGGSITRNNWYSFTSMEQWGTDDVQEVVKRVASIFGRDDFAEALPIEGAAAQLTRLEKEGHQLFAITGRPESLRPQTLKLLDKYYSGIFTTDTVYFVDHFSHDGQKMNKADVARELQLTHFIDDQVEHSNLLHAAGIKTVLFSQEYPWNQVGAAAGVAMLSDWESIGNYLDSEAVKG